LVAFVSHFFFFAQFPLTRDFPWVNFLLFGLSMVFLVMGLRQGFRRPPSYQGRIVGPILAAVSVGVLGFFCFSVFVESKNLPSAVNAPKVGQKAPEFSLSDIDGRRVSLSELLSTPIPTPPGTRHVTKGVLLIFYRGYWWPFCNSELRGVEKSLDTLESLGIRPVAISVDAPEVSRDLCHRRGYTYTFLSDPQVQVIKQYDLVHPGAGINHHDIARPAEFLVDSSGVVRWVNLTEDFRIRAQPAQMIEAAKTLQ
jgi:peroxiredoxin